jgi:hypothetical protein
VNPLFTCFGSANEGLPLNPRVAFYYETTPDAFGFIVNPFGFAYRDLGLGSFIRSGFGSAPNPNSTWTQQAPTVDGQMQGDDDAQCGHDTAAVSYDRGAWGRSSRRSFFTMATSRA